MYATVYSFEFASLIFALWRSETSVPGLKFAYSPIFLHNPVRPKGGMLIHVLI